LPPKQQVAITKYARKKANLNHTSDSRRAAGKNSFAALMDEYKDEEEMEFESVEGMWLASVATPTRANLGIDTISVNTMDTVDTSSLELFLALPAKAQSQVQQQAKSITKKMQAMMNADSTSIKAPQTYELPKANQLQEKQTRTLWSRPQITACTQQ
jgi:hypothetical protein